MQNYNSKVKIIFFGSSNYVIPIIEVLSKNFDLALIITTEKNPTDAVPSYCIKNKIPYLSVNDFSNHNTKYLILNTKSPVAILADFGLIIPKEILNAFPKGIINIHPSLLPKYRGPTPVQTAILNGEKITGVSIIKLDEQIDHGPILGLEREKILDTDTSDTLYRRLFEKGANLLLKVLPNYLSGSLNPTPQNHKEATFTPHLTRQDGFLNISNATTAVIRIERMIRAYYPWPGVFTKLKMNPSASSGEKLKIVKLLPFGKIQVEGKKPMSYKDFLNGYPEIKQQLGKLLEQLD